MNSWEAAYRTLSVGIETMIQSKLEFEQGQKAEAREDDEIPDDDPEVLADAEVKAA